MRIIYNKLIPFKGYTAVNLFGVVFARKGTCISQRTLRHEQIHTAQMKELLYIGFYLWYLVEWLIRLFMKGNAYSNISFERESYCNDRNLDYLTTRKHFAFIKYLSQ